jgi:outer membrane receptor protein involved in Fe transport
MHCKRSKLRDAITLALVVGATAAAASTSALAQTSSSATNPDGVESASTLDTVTVTGTRLRSQTMTASSPVAEIQKEEFQYTGATKVEDLVNQYPQLSPSFDNFENNGSTGYATVDLRGLGPQRTLTLFNGRRIPKGTSETPDLSIIPAALISRVDILTGGASAVYGSDAVAGVVNFILDENFEGVSVNFGYNAYQHDNDNGYLPGLMDQRDFDYPTGGSGFDGISRNVDLAIGGAFGEGGHAVGWATWRKNDALFQAQRDFSSCALNAAGTACGGSGTADPANFYVYSDSTEGFYGVRDASGTWAPTDTINIYNYAPVNYYQRPDTRFTAGTNVKYEINDRFQPYLSTLYVNRRSSTQIAPSGAFFTDITLDCAEGNDFVGASFCSDLGITDDTATVYVAKRNVEGGPRISNTETSSYSLTAGMKGELSDRWGYDASYTYSRSTISSENLNDFVTTRVRDGLLGCPSGSFDGCVPYDVWNDAVSTEAAESLAGIGITNYVTSMSVLNAFVTGDLGISLPSAAGDNINLVAGFESRKETYERLSDSNTVTGNFTGVGGPVLNASGDLKVDEFFMEGVIPLLSDKGFVDKASLELGYRLSDYNTSGEVNTFKVGFGMDFAEKYRFRAGFNRAIRAPSILDLYSAFGMGLWGGTDGCSGASPVYTVEQCALTGLSPDRYGSVPANTAAQYNQLSGGNLDLNPEKAETWTVGFAANPIASLNLSVDYYDITIDDAIQSLGGQLILDGCAQSGDPTLCTLIRRNPATGDLFRGSDPDTAGLIVNPTSNYGSLVFRGIDLSASYGFDLGPGRLFTSFTGTYVLEQTYEPLPGVTEYDCSGVVSANCNTAEWRHIANVRYSIDRYTAGLRWRYIGEKDYEGTTDRLLVNNGNKIDAYNYLDLSGSVTLGDYTTWTIGVNNVFDREPPMVGGGLAVNGNSVRGYDQVGRYLFTSVAINF